MMRSITHHVSKDTLKYSSMLALVMIHSEAKLELDVSSSLTGLGITTRESRARSFPVAKVVSEIGSLFGSPLEIRRSEENIRETERENDRIPRGSGRYSRLFSSVLLVSRDIQSKLLTSLNILITRKDRARKTRIQCTPKLA